MCRIKLSVFVIYFLFTGYNLEVYSQLDPLQTEKCRLRCIHPERQPEMKCLRDCLSIDVKPGKCPTETNSTIPAIEKLCINSCKTDPQCTGIKKCCRHDCGVVCMTPTHLYLVSGLPPIPTHVKVHVNDTDITTEGIPIHLKWNLHHSKRHKQVQFVVEERHSYDDIEIEYSNKWTVVRRTPHKHATVKNLCKPGVYYQFRVYSVNANGTLGASKPSRPFNILPNITDLIPDEPIDFGVGAQSWGNGSLRFLLVWKKAPTLIPIYRYKLSWSMLMNDTLYQNNRYLAGNLDHYWLSNILPKTEYFLELNAMVKFDDKKIPGKPARIVVRTHERPPPKKRRKIMPDEMDLKFIDSVEKIRVSKLYWIQDSLYATVDWEPIVENDVANYSVTWVPNSSCKEDDAWYVARASIPQFEIYDLIPGCDYNISIKAIYNQTLYLGNASLPLVNCAKKLTSIKPLKKEYNFFGVEIPQSPENKPIEIVNCI